MQIGWHKGTKRMAWRRWETILLVLAVAGCTSPATKAPETAASPAGSSAVSPAGSPAGSPAIAAKRLKQEARDKFDRKDYAGAVAAWTAYLATNPGQESAEAGHYGRGLAHLKLNNAQSADQDFSAALQLDPNSAKTYGARARARVVLNNSAGAVADYQQSIALYQKQGKTREAAKIQDQLTKLQQGAPTSLRP